MAAPLKITFKVYLEAQERWTPATELLGRAELVVDSYLRLNHLTCCSFQGGFFIDIDGKPWSDESTVDEFHMTMTWLHALTHLFEGAPQAKAAPWEESGMTLTRIGDELELQDVHYSGAIVLPKVRVPMNEFARLMYAESAKFANLVAELKADVERRRRLGVSEAVEQKFKEIEDNLPVGIDLHVAELAKRLDRALPQLGKTDA